MDYKFIDFYYLGIMSRKKLLIEDEHLNQEQKALGLILCVAQDYQSALNKSVANMGISLLQAQILNALIRAPESKLTVNQIKDRMFDDSSNVSRALNKLMNQELIKKKRSRKDQRVVHIQITQKGKAMHEVAENSMVPLLKLPLSQDEITQLFELLRKV
jgi:DNA-binding MarR family transcriptional regulator